MSRPPFPSASPVPTAPVAPARASALGRPPARDPAERRTLVVGKGISVQGSVQDAERLVVEGTVIAEMLHATEVSIAFGGVFKGDMLVQEAEVAGLMEGGTLTAETSLVIRSTGKVIGTARCRRLQVEDGGQISGKIEMITETSPSDLPSRPAADSAG